MLETDFFTIEFVSRYVFGAYVNGDGGGGGAASVVTPPTLFSRTKTGHTSEVYIFCTMWFFILCATPRA